MFKYNTYFDQEFELISLHFHILSNKTFICKNKQKKLIKI